MTPTIELRSLQKTFDNFVAVDDVSAAIPAGSVFGLLGPNGAGKTTTLRMLMDIIAPDSGEVLFFGRGRRRSDLERIGYLPEERGLYRKMTVTDHLVFLAQLHGVSRRQAYPAIDRLLERVELTRWSKSKVEELSKGMQQKIQLVGTLLHEPEILVLDEPFAGLDPLNQSLFKDILAEFKNSGKTILLSTHVMEHAEKLCDQICLISQGRVVLSGELREIKRGFGGRSYRLVAAGDLSRLSSLRGVEECMIHEDHARLLLHPEADGAAVLREAVQFLAVEEFRSEEPELEEIFITAVRQAAEPGAPAR
jgi:ABC-2 type transport system ATP-binding protein